MSWSVSSTARSCRLSSIRLTGGQEVVAAITKDSAEGLSLAAGDAVTAVIKATEVMVGKD